MKKILVFSLLIIGALGLTSMSAPVNDIIILTKKKYTKTIEKSFPIDKKGEVQIINKYGNIDMHTWNKNEVKITVEIEVNATSQSVAEDVFEKISINFDNSKSSVLAETIIESKESYWWNWGKSIKSDYEINYTVYMPATCSADFSNKYGNIDMMDLDNDANISVKYGDLTMGDLEGDLALYLGYGNAFIGQVSKNIEAEVAYSKFRAESMENLTCVSKYSGLIINNAGKVVLESKYDNYELGNIRELVNEGKYDNFIIESCNNIVIETKYSDFKVGTLHKSLVGELSYGGVKVKNLKKGFDKIVVESNYTGIYISPEAGTGFELILDAQYVDINIPDTADMNEEKDGSSRYIKASYKGKSPGKMVFEMDYGQLKIQ